jgi:group I intron endonuclease
MPGIVYHLFCTDNGKAYVGQTWNDFDKRMIGHRTHKKMLVGRAIRKHGEQTFVETVLVSGLQTQAELDVAEDAFIVEFGTLHPNGYNLKRGGAHGKHSAESRQKNSEAHKGLHSSPATEWKRGMTPWNKGKAWSPEVKEKMRQAKLGKPRAKKKGA